MKIFRYKYLHVWISIALFTACLFFPAFYSTKGTEEPVAWDSLSLLLFGWLGSLIGIFYWYANVIYLIALIKAKDLNLSSTLGFLALALALLFLSEKEIVINESPETAPITGYGWGYILWVSSFGIFWIGQSQLLLNKSKK